MPRIATGFDRLAPIYSILSTLMFGKSLQQAQQHFIPILKPADRILILGGGSGDFLLALLKQHSEISIDYIDISPNMIELAKRKTSQYSTVKFIVGTEQDIPNQTYSAVITNFYLDLFPDQKLSQVIHKISNRVVPEVHWFVADFVQTKSWHSIMLWIMYRFFNLTTGIEARALPDWQSTLKQGGFQEIKSKKFYRGFIQATVYKKDIKA